MRNPDGLGPHLIEGSAPTPLYHQIFLILRDRIVRGEYEAGRALPGEEELARLFDVSRITAKRALNELANARLVTRRRGRGTVVADGVSPAIVTGSFETLVRSLERMGADTTVELLDLTEGPAGAEAAQLLQIDPEARVLRLRRLRRLHGEPFSHIVTYLPAFVADKLPRRALKAEPMLRLLTEAGVEIAEAEQWISAVGAEPGVAAALAIAPGSPSLRIVRVVRSRSGAAVQLIYAHYRPERFTYHMVAPAAADVHENG